MRKTFDTTLDEALGVSKAFLFYATLPLTIPLALVREVRRWRNRRLLLRELEAERRQEAREE